MNASGGFWSESIGNPPGNRAMVVWVGPTDPQNYRIYRCHPPATFSRLCGDLPAASVTATGGEATGLCVVEHRVERPIRARAGEARCQRVEHGDEDQRQDRAGEEPADDDHGHRSPAETASA